MFKRIKGFLLENRNTRQTLVKNTFWLAVGQVASRLVRAAILVYAARVLGATQYGIFSYALSLAGLFTIFADLGLGAILIREAAQKPEKKSQYFSTIFSIKVGLLILTAFAVIFGAPLISKIHEISFLIPFIALLLIMDDIRNFIGGYFRAEQKMEKEALLTVITNISIAVFGWIILAYSKTATSLTFTYAASAGLGTLSGIFLLREEFVHLISNFRKELVRPAIKAALPMTVLGVLGVFMLNTDMIMIGWWRSPEEIGWYAAAQRVIQILYTFPMIFSSAVFPVLSKAIAEKNDEKLRKLTEYSTALILGVAIPIALGGIILGRDIMITLFGSEYAPGTLSMQLLLVTLIFAFPLPLLSNYILAFNEQRRSIIPVAMGAIGNVVFNILLIPRWGIAGSSASTILAQILNVSILWYINKRIKDFRTLKHLNKIIPASIVMGLTSLGLQYLGINLFVNIIISGTVYAGILFALKEKLIKESLIIFKR